MKFFKTFLLSLVTVMLLLCTIGTALMAQPNSNINPNYWYRITNMWKGENLSLAVVNDGQCNCHLQLAQTAKANEQLWKISPTKNGYYRLKPKKQGKGKCLSLKNNVPQIADCGKFQEQLWQFVSSNDGHFHLYPLSQGESKVLDVMNDGKNSILLGQKKGYSGQFWKLTKVMPIQNQQTVQNGNGQANKRKNPNVNQGRASRGGRGTNPQGRTATTPSKPRGSTAAGNQPSFLKAAPQFATPTSDVEAPLEKTIVKGTKLQVSPPPSNWQSLGNPITLKVLKAVIANGKTQVSQGAEIKVHIRSSPTRRNPKAVKMKLLEVATSEGQWTPLQTDEMIINELDHSNKEQDSYLGSDILFEVPVETGISFELKENAVMK